MKKGNLMNIVVVIALLLVVTIGVSFAFFTAQIAGGESSTTITVAGGSMNITYASGANINVANIHPRPEAWVNKSFTIKGNNTTAVIMKYKVSLVIGANTFSTNALQYQLVSTNTGANGTIIPSTGSNQNIATGGRTISLGEGQFTAATGGDKVHTYQLNIFFPDTGSPQNVDQGKNFTAYIKTEAVQ